MFDLGQYATSILASYAIAITGTFAIIAMSLYSRKQVTARIRVIEKKNERPE